MKNNNILFALLLSMAACHQQKPLDQVVEGKVKRETISIAPKIPGRLLEIRIEEGQEVMAGDTLAVVDVPEVEAKLAQAEGAVLAAKAQYEMATNGATTEQFEQVTAMHQAAFEQFQLAEKSFARVSNMFADSLIPAQQYDEVQAKYQAAKAQLAAATAKKKEVGKGARSEKVSMALGQYQRAKGALLEAQTAYRESFIIAPVAMRVETISLKKGELALPGYNLFSGYLQEDTYFRFTVGEAALAHFPEGNTYEIEIPYLSQTVKANLRKVQQLAAYAHQTSAYPQYEIGEAQYELRFYPIDKQAARQLYNNASALYHLPAAL